MDIIIFLRTFVQMKTKVEIERFAKEKIKEHLNLDWKFIFKITNGSLGTMKRKGRIITFNPNYLDKDELVIKNTILHEIAHAMVFEEMKDILDKKIKLSKPVSSYVGHRSVWKDKCRKIGAIPRAKYDEKFIKVLNEM